MLTIKIGNACWQLYEKVSGGNVFMLLDCFNCIVCNCINPIRQGTSSLYPLDVLAKSPWVIVGMDFVIGFVKHVKHHLSNICFSCLPFHKDGTLASVS